MPNCCSGFYAHNVLIFEKMLLLEFEKYHKAIRNDGRNVVYA